MNERTSDLLAAAAAVVNEWDAHIETQTTQAPESLRMVGLRISQLDNALHAFPPGVRGGDD